MANSGYTTTASNAADIAAQTGVNAGNQTYGAFSPASEPSVLSTQNGQKVLDSHIADHTQDMANISNTNNAPLYDTKTGKLTDAGKYYGASDVNGTKTGSVSDATKEAIKAQGGITADEAAASGINVNDTNTYSYDTNTGYFVPKDQKANVENTYQADVQKTNDAFSSILSGFDEASRNLASSILGIYSSRITAQQEVNRRELQGYNTLNVRDGTSRYAGGVAQSILTADENAGLDRIKTIAQEEAGKLAEANSNLQDKKYTAFIANRQELDKLRTEKNATLKDLQEKAAAQQKVLQAQQLQTKKDQSIANIVSQGVTDPKEVLKSLTGSGIPFTIKEVTDTLKMLAPNGNLEKLNGAIGEYYSLVDNKVPLPPSIAALPKDQQPYAYVKYKGELERKSTSGGTSTDYKFSNADRGKLTGSGLSSDEIQHIQEGINQYGLNEVLTKETGLTEEQQNALRETVTGKAHTFLDDAYIKKAFDPSTLEAAAKSAGFGGPWYDLGGGTRTDDYITHLMDTVKIYRDSGMSDKEIFTKLDKQING